MNVRRYVAVAVLGASISSCGILGLGDVTVVGTINANSPPLVPDSVQAGEPFEVVVTTVLGGSCMRAGNTDVEIDANAAIVTPYDVQEDPGLGGGCNLAIYYAEHRAELSFLRVGPATVVVNGIDAETNRPLALTYVVEVR